LAEYFYDTYALIEYVNANKKFKKYFQEHMGITSKLNLMELYYAMLKDISKEKAKKISYVDAIGYQIALEKNLKFLTGDKQFKEMKNVEFVK